MTRRCILITLFCCAALFGELRLPPYTRQVLSNGIVLDLMPRAGVPLVQFRIMVRGGVEAEPANLAGLAGVTAQLLRKGTSKRSADQFSQELDFLGGSFQNFDSQLSSVTTISGEFLKKDFDRGLDLMADAVLHPTFPEAEVRKTLAQRIDGAKSIKDNPQAAINSYFATYFFGPGHPYGHPADETTLGRIQRQEIVDFHQRIYCGRNITVIVTGDFDGGTAAAKIRDAFSGAPAGEIFEWAKSPRPAAPANLLLIDKPDATQTYFYIGQPGVDRASPDRVKLLLINTLFGGRFTSMLNEALRVQSGLTYGAACNLQRVRLPGSIIITTYTKTDTTEKAIDMALDVLKQLGEKGITAEQLASVKAYIKGTFPTQQLETTDQLSNVLADLELYGLNKGEIDDFFSSIDAATLVDINATAKKYYKPNHLTFVLLGNAAKIRQTAAKYAPKVTEISVNKPGFGGE
ncbi:MAG TPA: pitrilysin family protein [Bryobacteraceae bacterium]|nr:pitrilysin family protein [Bryobacteraceae bacterium]